MDIQIGNSIHKIIHLFKVVIDNANLEVGSNSGEELIEKESIYV